MNKKVFLIVGVAALGGAVFLPLGENSNESVTIVQEREVVKKRARKVYTKRYSDKITKSERNQEIIETIASRGASEAVLDIIGEGEKKGYNDRMGGIKKLTREINGTDKKALVEFLHTQFDESVGMREIAFNAVKNDVLDVLLRQNELVDGLGQILADMANDESYGDMWRDYAVQFFANYYEQKFSSTEGTENTEEENGSFIEKDQELTEEQRSMLDTYWGFAEDAENSSAGTALIGLKYLSRNYGEIDQKRIVKTAVDIINDDTRPIGPKITALRMFDTKSGDTIDEEAQASAADAARIIAQTGENTVLRMAAVATLGDIGSDADVEFLQSVLESEDKNMRKVAQAALDKINDND
jgi:hypothetical protein